ncbi:hypothetical protein OPZ25_004918 [Salmonella enterica subsp. enterica]|nr:hypothetical protein [Salmonella enterica subsp. enterica]
MLNWILPYSLYLPALFTSYASFTLWLSGNIMPAALAATAAASLTFLAMVTV